MRPVHLARLDKTRPVVILTREAVRQQLRWVTVAPVTSRVRGLSTEVEVGSANGLDQPSAISCDNVTTIPVSALGRLVGYLTTEQESALARALVMAFDLDL